MKFWLSVIRDAAGFGLLLAILWFTLVCVHVITTYPS